MKGDAVFAMEKVATVAVEVLMCVCWLAVEIHYEALLFDGHIVA